METLSQSYGFLLGKVLQRMEGKFADALTPYNMDARQYGVLLFVKENPYSSQKEIGENLQIDRTTMVDHIDHLETLGFVERTKNPHDRRAYSVKITKKGSDAAKACWDLLENSESEVLSILNAQEKQSFKAILIKIWSSRSYT